MTGTLRIIGNAVTCFGLALMTPGLLVANLGIWLIELGEHRRATRWLRR